MKKLILAALIAGCGKNSESPRQYASAIIDGVTGSRTASPSMRPLEYQTRLEAKVDRLEALLKQVIETKNRDDKAVVEFNVCFEQCLEIPANIQDDDLPWNVQYKDRKSCFDSCDKIKPRNIIGGC